MKYILIALMLVMLVDIGQTLKDREHDKRIAKCEANSKNIEWSGYLMYGYESPDVMGPATHIQTNIQLGLRGDGVIVYRKTD